MMTDSNANFFFREGDGVGDPPQYEDSWYFWKLLEEKNSMRGKH